MALDTSGNSILETTSKLLSGMCYERERKMGVRMRTTGSSGAGPGAGLDSADRATGGPGVAAAAWAARGSGVELCGTAAGGLARAAISERASASRATTTLSVMFSIIVIMDASIARMTAART